MLIDRKELLNVLVIKKIIRLIFLSIESTFRRHMETGFQGTEIQKVRILSSDFDNILACVVGAC